MHMKITFNLYLNYLITIDLHVSMRFSYMLFSLSFSSSFNLFKYKNNNNKLMNEQT